MQLLRAEDNQHHALVEVASAAIDAHALADQRPAAIAADDVLRPHDALPLESGHVLVGLLRGVGRPAVEGGRVFAGRQDSDASACIVLVDSHGGPAEQGRHGGQLLHPLAQHRLGAVLRQSLVALEVEVPHRGAAAAEPLAAVEIRAHQVAIRGHVADRVVGRHDARGSQLVDALPEVEVLQRSIRQVLALGDRLRTQVPLDQHTRDAALPQLDRQPHAHRPTADDRDLVGIRHAASY